MRDFFIKNLSLLKTARVHLFVDGGSTSVECPYRQAAPQVCRWVTLGICIFFIKKFHPNIGRTGPKLCKASWFTAKCLGILNITPFGPVFWALYEKLFIPKHLKNRSSFI
jgi:hypothetical protein